jgi:hypothetical protein
MTKEQLCEYLEQVAAENARIAIANPGDLRSAINAVMTLDGFFGTLHSELHERGLLKDMSDDQWKDELAQQSREYAVLRDCAFALKHGRLTRPKARLVRRSDQILTMPSTFDQATFDRSSFDVETVWIDAVDTDYRADHIIEEVLRLARQRLAQI